MSVLILAEHNNATLNPATLSCVSAALQLGTQIDLLVLGEDCDKVCEIASTVEGVTSIICCKNKRFLNILAEDLCALVKSLVTPYEFILAPATTFGKNCLPRLGAIFDVQPISDIIEI